MFRKWSDSNAACLRTALDVGWRGGWESVVRALLKSGADIGGYGEKEEDAVAVIDVRMLSCCLCLLLLNRS